MTKGDKFKDMDKQKRKSQDISKHYKEEYSPEKAKERDWKTKTIEKPRK